MSDDQEIIDFTEDIEFNGDTALLLEKLVDLNGESFFNVFVGKLLFYLIPYILLFT